MTKNQIWALIVCVVCCPAAVLIILAIGNASGVRLRAAPPVVAAVPPTLESGTYRLRCFDLTKGPYTPETIKVVVVDDVIRFETKNMRCVGVIDGTRVQIMTLNGCELFFGRTDPDYRAVRGVLTVVGNTLCKFEIERVD